MLENNCIETIKPQNTQIIVIIPHESQIFNSFYLEVSHYTKLDL